MKKYTIFPNLKPFEGGRAGLQPDGGAAGDAEERGQVPVRGRAGPQRLRRPQTENGDHPPSTSTGADSEITYKIYVHKRLDILKSINQTSSLKKFLRKNI